jgi:hypothetical protein
LRKGVDLIYLAEEKSNNEDDLPLRRRLCKISETSVILPHCTALLQEEKYK